MKEINELYSYAENPQLADNVKCWEGTFDGGMLLAKLFGSHSLKVTEWTQTPSEKRIAHLNYLLEGLEHKDIEVRYYSCKRILYLVQGIDDFLMTSPRK